MKNKLIILLLFACFISFGQSVPNTTTFSLDSVVHVVNPTTNSLGGCFADANATYFDLTYSGAKDRLSNFRNYGTPTCISSNVTYTSSPIGSSTTFFTLNTPAVVAGDLLLILVGQMGSTAITTPSGYSVQTNINPTYVSSYIYYKPITATASAGTVNISTGSINSDKFGICIKISNAENSRTFYDGFTSTVTYSSRTSGSFAAPVGCSISLAALIVRSNQPTIFSLGTGWIGVGNGDISTGGGWSYSLAKYIYTTASTSPGTSWTFPSSYIATQSLFTY